MIFFTIKRKGKMNAVPEGKEKFRVLSNKIAVSMFSVSYQKTAQESLCYRNNACLFNLGILVKASPS